MRKWILFALVGLVLLYVFGRSVEAFTPSPTCPTGTTFDGTNCLNSSNVASVPQCPTGYHYDINKCIPDSDTPDPTSYGDILKGMQDANNGPLPPPITESPDTDTASRPTTGDVFASGGPFSGQPGTGRGSGAAAASNMTGNTYGPSGPTASLTAFDFYPKSGPSPAPPGTSLRVKGPSWGGRGQSAASASASSGIPNPFLYGPGSGNKSSSGSDGSGFGFQLNSGDTSMLPSLDSLGSNPENQYAPTSRVPGDQDLVPNPYLQSTSYSLANNSQKTDPVPFLANFSAFQK